jgi:hypothetical protein
MPSNTGGAAWNSEPPAPRLHPNGSRSPGNVDLPCQNAAGHGRIGRHPRRRSRAGPAAGGPKASWPNPADGEVDRQFGRRSVGFEGYTIAYINGPGDFQLNPTEFLESLQRASAETLGCPARPADTHAQEDALMGHVLEQLIEVRRGQLTEDQLTEFEANLRGAIAASEREPLPTAYERRPHYVLLRRAVDDIERVIGEQGLQLPSVPVVGTLRTGRTNAMTVSVPGSNDSLVLFESELFHFAYLLSKAVVTAMAASGGSTPASLSPKKEDVTRRIREMPEVLRHFQEVLMAYVAVGRPGVAPPYILAEPWATVAAQLARSMRLFVLGHEYGHLLAPHRTATSASMLPGGLEVTELRYLWAQELEADSWGLRLMVGVEVSANRARSAAVDFPFCYWGADFYFSCHQVLQGALSILSGEAQPARTHPPPKVRRENLRAELFEWFPSEQAEPAIELADALDGVLRALWDESKGAICRYHESGVSAAPTWVSG